MKKMLVAAILVFVGIPMALLSGTAGATETAPTTIACVPGWYVNPDESALLPQSKPEGLLFDGPSLIHHTTDPVALADVPSDGAFTVSGSVTGSKPLFKMETSGPYSTINKTADGKFWSSKITTGDGSQGSPVATVALLIGKWNYTADTKVVTFGVGYANDAGNKALVTAVFFRGVSHSFGCKSPSPSTSASASASATPSASASVKASGSATPVPSGVSPSHPTLPLTGSNPLAAGIVAGVFLAAGAILFATARRRRVRFEA